MVQTVGRTEEFPQFFFDKVIDVPVAQVVQHLQRLIPMVLLTMEIPQLLFEVASSWCAGPASSTGAVVPTIAPVMKLVACCGGDFLGPVPWGAVYTWSSCILSAPQPPPRTLSLSLQNWNQNWNCLLLPPSPTRNRNQFHNSPHMRHLPFKGDFFTGTRHKSVDSVLPAKANGPAECLVTAMTQCLQMETVCQVAHWFEKRFRGESRAPEAWKILHFEFRKKPDAKLEKGLRVGPTLLWCQRFSP